MATANYEAHIYTDLTKSSVELLNTLQASDISRLERFIRNYIFAGPGAPPTGAPWSGTIVVDTATKAPLLPVVHSLVDALIVDWNSKYSLQLKGGSAGPDAGDEPRNETFRLVYVNGLPVIVPNYPGNVVGSDEPFDPYAAFPLNPGLTGALRIEVCIETPRD